MLLSSLDIQQHRGIENLSLGDLSPVSIIVGPNNSGKSSILEAIALLLRPLDPPTWMSTAWQREQGADLLDALWSVFRSSGILQRDEGPQESKPMAVSGEVCGEKRAMRAHAIVTPEWAFESDPKDSENADIELKVELNEEKYTLLFRRSSRGNFARLKTEARAVASVRCMTVTPITHYRRNTLVSLLSRAVDAGRKGLALEMMQVFDPAVKSIDVSGGPKRHTIVVDHARRGIADLASFGDGMRRSVALALSLSGTQNGVLLIDELETGIHPKVLESVFGKLFNAAKLANVQIIATTHSLEALDAVITATEDSPGSLAAFHLFSADSQRGVRRYAHDRLKRLRASGLDLR